MLLNHKESQLVLVDYQPRLMPALFGHEAVMAKAMTLAKLAKLFAVPLWITEQMPDKLGQTPADMRALAQGVFDKTTFDATPSDLLPALTQPPAPSGNARSLPKHLRKDTPTGNPRTTVVIAGCETHVCLLQTALGLVEEELDVWVVTDACTSRTERDRDAAFDRLAGAGVELVTTEMVAFEWMRDADHPKFKEMLALIK